jgi:uncharacterized phage protein gp47/JayE
MPEIYTDFSGRDYTATLEWLYSILRQDVPELTDFNHSDPGIALTRLVGRALDQSNFYIDEVFAEGYKDSARFKQSLINIAKTVDILPKIASAASTELVITRTPEAFYRTMEISIPKGTAFYRSDSVPYVCIEDYTIPVGTDSITIEVYQGVYQTRTITETDLESVDLSGHVKYNLGTNVAARTITVIHGDDDQPWTEVDSFYRSTSTDLHYRLELYADEYNGETDTVFLVLGDGRKGSAYPGSPMTVGFVQTDGPSGNTGASTITICSGNYPVMMTVTNPDTATGGSYSETVEDFRSRIPDTVSTQRRGVTRSDYEDLIRPIPGVGDCQTTDRNTDQEYPWEYVCIYVLASGGGDMSTELTRAVQNKLTSYGALGGWQDRYILKDATPVSMPITCRLSVSTGYSSNAVTTALRAAITGLFAIEYGIIGRHFAFSDLNTTAASVAGVNWVEFDTPTANILIDEGSYFTVGTITVTVV